VILRDDEVLPILFPPLTCNLLIGSPYPTCRCCLCCWTTTSPHLINRSHIIPTSSWSSPSHPLPTTLYLLLC